MSGKRIRRLFFFILALIPIASIVSIAIHAHVNTRSIFPSNRYTAINWWPIGNKETVISSLQVTSRKIAFEFTLEGSFPYAGLGILLDDTYPFLDLSRYSEISVRLTARRARHFGVIIQTYEKGLTELNGGSYGPLRYCQIRTEIEHGTDVYAIKLADLKEPEWWLSLYSPKGKALDAHPLERSSILQVFFDDAALAGQRDRIEVEQIVFNVFSGCFWMVLVAASICYYVVCAFFLIILPHLQKTKNKSSRYAFVVQENRRYIEQAERDRDGEVVYYGEILRSRYFPRIYFEGYRYFAEQDQGDHSRRIFHGIQRVHHLASNKGSEAPARRIEYEHYRYRIQPRIQQHCLLRIQLQEERRIFPERIQGEAWSHII
jgi:hypothetical protein